MNTLLYRKNKNIPKTHQRFPEHFCISQNLSKTIFRRSSFDLKIISYEICQKHFPEFYHSPNFTQNFETILVHMRFSCVQQLNLSGRMMLFCPMISQSDCEKEGRMNSHNYVSQIGFIFKCLYKTSVGQ